MEIPHTKSAEIFFTELEIILRKMLDKYKSVCYNDYSKWITTTQKHETHTERGIYYGNYYNE